MRFGKRKRNPAPRRRFYDDETGDMVTMELMPSPWDGLHKAVWGEVERTPAPKIEGKSDEGTA